MFYEVITKCGHVGKGHYVIKSFPVCASSKKEVSIIGRNIPRVKHDAKDAVLMVQEIDYGRYLELRSINDNDPYFRCKNIQEQRLLCDIMRLDIEKKEYKKEYYVSPKYQKKGIRKPKKYILNYLYNCSFD